MHQFNTASGMRWLKPRLGCQKRCFACMIENVSDDDGNDGCDENYYDNDGNFDDDDDRNN